METTKYEASTDKTGAFKFTGVDAGKYAIINLSVTFPLGGKAPSLSEMVVRNSTGTFLMFDCESSTGLDLGDLRWP